MSYSARAYLFDIDGTLIRTGGSGRLALTQVLKDRYGIEPDFDGWHPFGATDYPLFESLLRVNLPAEQVTPVEVQAVLDAYVELLPGYVSFETGYTVMPAADRLVEALSRTDALLGLCTGNIEKGARIKLEPAGLNRYFEFGGFGEDGPERAGVVEAAYQRACERLPDLQRNQALVVGDTPADITSAKACGLPVLAVATSVYDKAALSKCDPDYLLPDLHPWLAELAV